jgi:acetate kinase
MVMKILVLNCGSSTLKIQLIQTGATPGGPRDRKHAHGIIDRIGAGASCRFEDFGGFAMEKAAPVRNHEEAVRLVID